MVRTGDSVTTIPGKYAYYLWTSSLLIWEFRPNWRRVAGGLHLIHGLLQVGDDVVHVLDAYRQADEVG